MDRGWLSRHVSSRHLIYRGGGDRHDGGRHDDGSAVMMVGHHDGWSS